MKHLTKEDFVVILESLKYSKKTFAEYDRYPDENFRKQQISKVEQAIKRAKLELNYWRN